MRPFEYVRAENAGAGVEAVADVAGAKFLAGGEFPYAVTTNDGTSILFKPYGVKLDIQPRVDSSGNVRAKQRNNQQDWQCTMDF